MNYQLNSYVSHKEAETLKEMIFKRVRERSENMMSDIQTDVMATARESFVSNNNPFSQILNSPVQTPATIDEPKQDEPTALHTYVDAIENMAQEEPTPTPEPIGFPQKTLAAGAVNQYRNIQEQASARQIQSTMREAREGLSNRKSFMGALEFLNSQAAVSLLNKRAGSGLEITA